MMFDNAQLVLLLPELTILIGTALVLIVDLIVKDKKRMWPFTLTLLTLLTGIIACTYVSNGEEQFAFNSNYIRDPMSDTLKIAILIIAIPFFIYAKEGLLKQGEWRGEFMVLILFAILGTMIITSANTFLILYLGLELLALSLYTLVAFSRNSKVASEAAIKYFILGALASGILLYGISMIYGTTGYLHFAKIVEATISENNNNTIFIFGLVFIIIGIAFKFGAVPFHMWVPDVYHGASSPVTMFISSIPKIAAVALIIRVLVGSMDNLHDSWQQMLIILAVLSMAVGNVIAIAQKSIKRMLAYSTIAHVGFLFLGIISRTETGYLATIFYVIIYALTIIGAFGILIALERKGNIVEQLIQVKGLSKRDPWLAMTMMFIMFSMIGIPPTVGFFAKLFILDAIIQAGFIWLSIIAIFFSIIGAFYYIRVIKYIYFDQPSHNKAIIIDYTTRFLLSSHGILIIILGIFPTFLIGKIVL